MFKFSYILNNQKRQHLLITKLESSRIWKETDLMPMLHTVCIIQKVEIIVKVIQYSRWWQLQLTSSHSGCDCMVHFTIVIKRWKAELEDHRQRIISQTFNWQSHKHWGNNTNRRKRSSTVEKYLNTHHNKEGWTD